jgi:hypothetical protein
VSGGTVGSLELEKPINHSFPVSKKRGGTKEPKVPWIGLREGSSKGTVGSLEKGGFVQGNRRFPGRGCVRWNLRFPGLKGGEDHDDVAETFSDCMVGIVGSLSKNKMSKSNNKGLQDEFCIFLWF